MRLAVQKCKALAAGVFLEKLGAAEILSATDDFAGVLAY